MKLVKTALNILQVMGVECLFVSLESAVSLLPSQPCISDTVARVGLRESGRGQGLEP